MKGSRNIKHDPNIPFKYTIGRLFINVTVDNLLRDFFFYLKRMRPVIYFNVSFLLFVNCSIGFSIVLYLYCYADQKLYGLSAGRCLPEATN